MKSLLNHTHLTGDRIFIVAAVATFVACMGMDASAANGRSDMGTVTNNQTYNAGNYYDKSSAERSNVHLRPLAIDPDHNHTAESKANITATTTTYATPPAIVAPAYGSTVVNTPVGTTRVYNTEPAYLAPGGTVSSTTYTATPAWTDPADVNARSDAGVIITYPVIPAPAATTTVTTTNGAVIRGY